MPSEPPVPDPENVAPSQPAVGSPLGQRAVSYVEHLGGAATEAQLIAFVFGSTGSPRIWQPLLTQILNAEERLTLRPDGLWVLNDLCPASETSLLSDFVAVDVETTGLQPRRQRIIEVAMIRFADGREIGRYHSLVNPERQLPKYIVKLTGIDDLALADAPLFGSIAGDVEAFIGDLPLLGHNVSFDINFLSSELERAGRSRLINPRIDVMGLAVRLVPGLRRPSLDNVAKQLGIARPTAHRAMADVEATATAAFRLVERARDLGIDSLERIMAISNRPTSVPTEAISRASSVLDRSILAEIPKAAGVYLMRDASDRVIYVGKAKNLRDRVGSYFSQPLGYTRKMDGLIESISRIETEQTGSELMALLLEAQLIRRYQPRYNVVMRRSEEYPFIRVDLSNAWPRITLSKARKNDGARYFGPFKNAKTTRHVVDLLQDHFPLRTCPRSFKTARSYGSPCIRLDLGKCLGPCVGRADRDHYMGAVRQVTAFLGGDDNVLLEKLWQDLETSAETMDFERARRLRNDLRRLESVVSSQRLLDDAERRRFAVLALPAVDPREVTVCLIAGGRRWATMAYLWTTASDALASRLNASWQRCQTIGLAAIDQESLDETMIIARWLRRHEQHPALVRFDPAAPNWPAIARRIASLTPTNLAWSPPVLREDGVAGEEDESDEVELDERMEKTDVFQTAGIPEVEWSDVTATIELE